MSRNNRKQNSRGTIGPRPPLLPVPQSGWLETKLRGESRLAQTKMPARLPDIDRGHFHSGNPDGDILTFYPVHSFLQAGDDPAASSHLPSFDSILFLHSVILFRYPAIKRGNKALIAFRSALVRFACSFLANTLRRNSGSDSSWK
jgi:hypothetical protein